METPQWQWPVRVEQDMTGAYRIVDKRGLPVTVAIGDKKLLDTVCAHINQMEHVDPKEWLA